MSIHFRPAGEPSRGFGSPRCPSRIWGTIIDGLWVTTIGLGRSVLGNMYWTAATRVAIGTARAAQDASFRLSRIMIGLRVCGTGQDEPVEQKRDSGLFPIYTIGASLREDGVPTANLYRVATWVADGHSQHPLIKGQNVAVERSALRIFMRKRTL
jgi:hypothetical protein